jgi:hypothetical protein
VRGDSSFGAPGRNADGDAIVFPSCDPFRGPLDTDWEDGKDMARKHAKTPARPKPSDAAPSAAAPADDVHASDPAAVHFFSAPPVTYDEEAAEAVDLAHEPTARRIPANPERRRRLTRVVAGAVALSCAICVAAAVRVATVHAATPGVTHTGEVAHAPPPAATEPVSASSPPSPDLPSSPSPQPQLPAPLPDSPPVAEAPPAVEPPAVEPPVVAAAPAAPAVPPPSSSETEQAPTEVDPVAAREAKRVSQRALERGDAKTSIEAGERSIALDPSDAEAWLILGAAYQTRGTFADARRCFSSCVRVAKRGPRGECGALLR